MADAPSTHTSWLGVVGMISLAAALLGSCETVDYTESLVLGGPIERVVLRGDIGDLRVRGAPRADAALERAVEGWRGAVRLRAEVSDGTLTIEARCEGWWACRVDHALLVPAGTSLAIDVGEGEVSIEGMTGDVEVALGRGLLTAEGLRGARIQAAVASGDVDLEMLTAPDDLRLAMGSGDAFLELPAGTCAGAFDLASGALSLDGVALNDGADCALEATIAAGDLHLIGS